MAHALPDRHRRTSTGALVTALATLVAWPQPRVRGVLRGADAAVFGRAIDLTELVDTLADRRHLLTSFARVVSLAGGDPATIDRALEEGEYPPIAYIALGEIATAERVASAALRSEAAQRDSRNPYAGLPRVHVSPPRMEAYLRRDADTLGPRVLARIAAHVDGCEACASVAETLRLRQTG